MTPFRQTCSAVFIALSLLMGMTGVHAADEAVTVVTAAAKLPELSIFHRLVEQAGLAESLQAGEVTVFAPTDEAFKALPAATMDQLSKDPTALKAVLTYHVLPTRLTVDKIDANTALTTVNGAKLTVSKAGDYVTVDDGLVTKADLPAGKGVIHQIDRVLLATLKK